MTVLWSSVYFYFLLKTTSMTPLQRLLQVIKLKQLAKVLSYEEFEQFKTYVSQITNDQNFIMNVLYGKSTNTYNPESIDKMIKIISKIIQSRTHHSDENVQSSAKYCIDDLPSPIIGEISSYLKQRSYSSFTRCNRIIFIITNSPNRLTQIDIATHDNNTSANLEIILKDHPQVTKLLCWIKHINQLKGNGHGINKHQYHNNRIRELRLYQYAEPIWKLEPFINIPVHNENRIRLNVDNITRQRYINFAKLERLRLAGSSDDHGRFAYPPCSTIIAFLMS